MPKVFALLLIALLITLPACGGGGDDDDGDVDSIADAETCEQLADYAIGEVQVMLDGLSDMTLAELQSGDTPEPVTDFEDQGDELQAKADELGCEEQEFLGMLDERVDQLEAEGPVAELLLEALQGGSFFEGLD